MNLKLNTKAIETTTFEIKANVSREMIEDLKNFHGFEQNNNIEMLHYEYEIKNENEVELLKKHTEVDYEDDNSIVFSVTKRQLRKIKIGTLEVDRDYAILKRIIFESKVANVRDILEKKLAREIDKEILNNLMKLKK